MKRFLILFFILTIALAGLPSTAAGGFSSDALSINEAAKSVLLLYIYDQKEQLIATGSGFVAFNDSLLVTNYHVIEGGSYIVAFDDYETPYSITKVLCADKESDIAILGFETRSGLKPLPLKAYSNLLRGETVVTIGSPEGFLNTVSTGVISALPEKNWIQFTAPVSHGSSGGALFNDYGEVIGVTSATLSSEDAQNINYAIHIAVVKAMYNAWDGKTTSISKQKTSASFNYDGVYEVSSHSGNYGSAPSEWTCPLCQTRNSTQFCTECGTEKPIWTCKCGTVNNGKFCGSCGSSIANLISTANTAIAYEKEGKYADVINICSSLNRFNSMSMETDSSKYWVAAEHVSIAYYSWAEQCLAEKNYKAAVEYFINAGDYSNSADRINSVYYAQGEYQFTQGRYDDAIQSFQWAEGYSDANERVLKCHYAKADALLSAGKYDDAVAAFKEAGSYNDAKVRILECKYLEGCAELEANHYEAAINAFKAAGSYKDASDKVLSAYYNHAQAELALGNYKLAEDLFKMAGQYSDAEAQALNAANKQKQEIYNSAQKLFDENDYLAAVPIFQSLDSYSDAEERVKACYYHYAAQCAQSKDYVLAIKYYQNAETYADSGEKLIECYLAKAKDESEKGKYTDARKTLANSLDNPEVLKLYLEITYEQGVDALNKYQYNVAMECFNACLDYADSSKKLYEAKTRYFRALINANSYTDAYKLYETEAKTNQPLVNLELAKPGDSGYIPRKVLEMANKMGFIEWISDSQTEYSSKYASSIKRMEANFGLEADGIITFTEMYVLNDTFYPGTSGSEVAKMLERISDLGFLDAFGKLPDNHSTYESKYVNGIKNLERQLSLKADGFLTSDERTVIYAQSVPKPAEISTLNLTSSGGVVTLSWSASKGAKWYTIYRNDKQIATVTGTYFTDRDAPQGKTIVYKVYAWNYSSHTSIVKTIHIEPIYKWCSVKEICKDQTTYLGKYVVVENLKKGIQTWEGADLSMLCTATISGKSYCVRIIFTDHNSWDWKGKKSASQLSTNSIFTSCKGQIVRYSYNSYYGNIPVIELTSVSW